MSRRTQLIHDRRVRFTLWGIIAILMTGLYLCLNPVVWKTESHRSPGVSISLESVSDYLIVVDSARLNASPDSFSEMSFSHAWINTFEQEIGPVSLMDANRFQDADLTRYRCIVLTSSASDHETWVPKIRTFLERGGTVIMEMPQGSLRTMASADGKGGIRAAQNLTYVLGLDQSFIEPLSALNLTHLTKLVGSAGPLDNSQTWMTIDGVPVIYSKAYATGTVITVDFDYGMLITALQQGRPLDDFKIRNMRDSNRIETSDLAQADGLNLPMADIFERFLIYGVLNQTMPVIGFWPFFDGLDGALIVSHHEEGNGDAALWMSAYEATFKATSTVFATAPLALSDDGLEALGKANGELALAFDWNASESSHAREPVGPFRFSPVWRQLNLEEQATAFKSRLDERTLLLSSQSRDGLWTDHYTLGFQMISAAGFRADASYRASYQQPGYAFSTGMPFLPLDTNGLVFNIQEFPIAFPKLETAEESSQLETFLKDSESRLHEAIGIAFEPGKFARDPVAEAFVTWQSAYKMASAHKHWVTGILNFFRFSRARFTGELKSRAAEVQQGNKRSFVVRIESLAPETGMTLHVPKTIGERHFVEARRGIQRAREDAALSDIIQPREISVLGFERMLVPLTKGFNAIDLIYE